MDRREFIQTGAAIGAVGLSGTAATSCGGILMGSPQNAGAIALPEMRSYLATVDKGLDHIATWDFSSQAALARKSLKTLYLTGMFADLPEEGQLHPGMQSRMADAMSDMDDAVIGMNEYLRGQTSSELAELRLSLRENADLPMEISEMLTSNGKAVGLSTRRRLQTRAILGQVGARMKHQSPGLLISEYNSKVDRILAQPTSVPELERRMRVQMGESAFWEKQRRLEKIALLWGDATGSGSAGGAVIAAAPADLDGGVEPDGGTETPSGLVTGKPDLAAAHVTPAIPAQGATTPTAPKERSEREQLLRAGGVAMGLGVLVAGVGGLVCTANPIAGAVVLTVGGVLLLVGLIVLIVGAAHKK